MIDDKAVEFSWVEVGHDEGWIWVWNTGDLKITFLKDGHAMTPNAENSALLGRVSMSQKIVSIRGGHGTEGDSTSKKVQRDVETVFRIFTSMFPGFDTYFFPWGDVAHRVY